MNKSDKIKFFDSLAYKWEELKARNKYYHKDIEKFLKILSI